ncbi:hypothetical protein Y032_0012g1761 [Ancylostoma ceylanicum]|uniref:Uncharacterized protein n=1 Tax=Ancylostoma ceylanicum TaxID=53326 RepID=A0A016VD60_9BILA|nr:hypothetical protein Y032_0012g1761 [Ancylostoma ceylanicum]
MDCACGFHASRPQSRSGTYTTLSYGACSLRTLSLRSRHDSDVTESACLFEQKLPSQNAQVTLIHTNNRTSY